ncbi:MAG TPA: cytochrome P450 [Amycolatopsis sp.]|uniref:cytochrome P450 n=1 Tax=Amycolatopsis sp. TaxID=37632 RepID=UPI002B45DA96|nr:cytochrome P450 [Amycolatopsis sp.]HKS45792.1 cytochrome P450 [Amycolatopsis sp.]
MAIAERPAREFPNTPSGQLGPNPVLDKLRATEPVSQVQPPYGDDAWLVTRYADVRTVLIDPRFSRAAAISENVPRATPGIPQADSIMSLDPPDHTRLRTLVAKAFTVARVAKLRPRAEQIASELLDRVVDHGEPCDLVEHFCLPMPVAVICALLGVPSADQGNFRTWSDAFLSTTGLSVEEIDEAGLNLYSYVLDLVNERRNKPTDDLLGALAQARDGEQRLSEHELVVLGVTMLIAGYETTGGQLGNFLYLLLSRPQVADRLRGEPDLLPSAIEEMLRCVPVLAGVGFARIATEDVELSGTTIRAGEAVLTSEPAANRDEEIFGEHTEFDIERDPNPHLTFGHGVHYCLGAQLARMELQVGIRSVLERFPRLRFATGPDGLRWKEGSLAHGVAELPVAWS